MLDVAAELEEGTLLDEEDGYGVDETELDDEIGLEDDDEDNVDETELEEETRLDKIEETDEETELEDDAWLDEDKDEVCHELLELLTLVDEPRSDELELVYFSYFSLGL